MRPLKLELTNFMSYDHTVLDLSEIKLASIVGPNGAGKSTLLQAISYALWGEVRTASHNDVVRRGTTECCVSLHFEAAGCEYIVTRRRSIQGKGSSELTFESVISGMDLHSSLTGPTLKDTQEFINGALGLSYNAFASSSLVQQGDASRFSDARPGERKELLAQMLGLEWFQEVERLARNHLSEIEYGTQRTLAAIATNEDRIVDVAELGHKLTLLKETARDLESQESGKRIEIADLRAELDTVKSLLAAHDAATDKIVACKNRIAELASEVNVLENERLNLLSTVQRGDAILARLEDYSRLRIEVNAASELFDSYNQLLNWRQYEQMHEEPRSRAVVQQELKAEKRVEIEADLSYIAIEIESTEKIIAGDDVAIERVSRLLDQAKEERARLHSSIESESGVLELLAGNECPTCGQHIDDPEALKKEREADIAVMLVDFDELEDSIDIIQTELESLLASKKDSQRSLNELSTKYDGLAYRVGEITKSLKELAADIADRDAKIAEARTKIAELEVETDGFSIEGYATAKQQLALLEDAPADAARLESAGARLKQVDADTEAKRNRLQQEGNLLDDLVREENELGEEINSRESKIVLDNMIVVAENELARILDAVKRCAIDVSVTSGKIEQQEKLLKDIDKAKSHLASLEAEKATADLLVKATCKTGAPALLIEAALPQIESDANGYLELMAPGTRLSLESQRMTQQGNARETLDIRVYREGHDAPLESLSGGERFRADLALRLAIGKMLARRSGTQIKFLAVDEGWGSLDGEGQDAVLGVVASLLPLFDLILVISHVESVAQSIATVGNSIEISKVGNVSRLEVK